MGAVYVATQLSTGKERALKVMLPQLVSNAKLRERFEREARVGALIESDHVVDVIGAGVDDETGLPWIAMELLDGQDLADYAVAHGCFSVAELVPLMRQLCHALGAAHRAGVVHRDIKPENVFVALARSAQSPWTVKVLDFGIAKMVAQAKVDASRTATIGSPSWMAPEQTEARAEITPATDVWALGLIAFWLLTGHPYWIAANEPDATMHALMREILFDPIPQAGERAREYGVAERLPDGFDAWFERCVARAPAARYPDATSAFAAFERMAEDAGVDLAALPISRRSSLVTAPTAPLSSRLDPGKMVLPPSRRQRERALGTAQPPAEVTTAPGLGPRGEPTVDAPREDAPTREGRPATFSLDAAAAADRAAREEAEPTEGDEDEAPPARRVQLSETSSPMVRAGGRPRLPMRRGDGLALLGAAAVVVGALWLALRDAGTAAKLQTVVDRPAALLIVAGAAADRSASPPPPASATARPRATARGAAASASARGARRPLEASNTAVAAPASAQPRKPFDFKKAHALIADKTRIAQRHCARPSLPPGAISVRVRFNPTTGLSAAFLTSLDGDAPDRRNCVVAAFGGLFVGPFDGDFVELPATVVFE
jgi:serine/threonine protein kinase